MNELASPSVTPSTAPTGHDVWKPLPANAWNEDAARHLLRRATWSAQPDQVEKAVRDGLSATLDRLFPKSAPLFPMPSHVAEIQKDAPAYVKRLQAANEQDRRFIQREERERAQQAVNELTIQWLKLASHAENAAYEKWVLFLADVYVVSAEKVRNPALIYTHYDILRTNAFGPAPVLTKAVSRSPAMIEYLDLQQSRKSAPNENFARELFELFTLGEGNYTENDIKEAARAFTGYRQRLGEFKFVPREADTTPKTVFGKTAPFTGDSLIDHVYKQRAAAAFLPGELVKFYLSDRGIPHEHLVQLGAFWETTGFDLRQLARRFFGSSYFYQTEFRGGMIKSPVQFYLGLFQDLDLAVTPFPKPVLGPLKQMGQSLFFPPNVRGWVGGRSWINSATLSARRQLVQTLFSPLNEAYLNADEQVELVAARAEGASNFRVAQDQFKPAAAVSAEKMTDDLVTGYFAVPVSDGYRKDIQAFLSRQDVAKKNPARNVAVTLLQSPEYQLC